VSRDAMNIEGLSEMTLQKLVDDGLVHEPADLFRLEPLRGRITTEDGTTILPVSKVSFGFASGGADFDGKNSANKDLFGGGSGAGISIQPVAFLVILNGEVKLMQLSIDASTPNALINLVPDVMEKISGFMSSRNDKNSKAE